VVGGRPLASPVGPVAHSDGDVLLHALTDALLGALGLPDIGELFPDDKASNEGRDSADFVREAMRRVGEAGWTVANLDSTVVLEKPRIGGVKGEIRRSIAGLLGVSEVCVNVKGKSHEGVDAIGEGKAIAAHVVVLLTCAAG